MSGLLSGVTPVDERYRPDLVVWLENPVELARFRPDLSCHRLGIDPRARSGVDHSPSPPQIELLERGGFEGLPKS